jgi:hypothetical protein
MLSKIPGRAHFEEMLKRLAEQDEREHLSWLSRPRLEIGDRNLDELTNTVGLPGERLALFKQLAVAYRAEPTIENYVRVRRCSEIGSCNFGET